ncbi:MAG: hypothetical protein U1A78_30690 [Polyangia bacterium]
MDDAAGHGPERAPVDRARERARGWLTRYIHDRPELRGAPTEQLLALLGDRAAHWSERVVALGLLTLAGPAPAGLAPLLGAIVRNDADPDYVRLDAAVALALLGSRDEGAVAVLRQVMSPKTYFALSQSNMELGAACIGLALLGDHGSRPHILMATRLAFNGIDRDAALALQVLDQLHQPHRHG